VYVPKEVVANGIASQSAQGYNPGKIDEDESTDTPGELKAAL